MKLSSEPGHNAVYKIEINACMASGLNDNGTRKFSSQKCLLSFEHEL